MRRTGNRTRVGAALSCYPAGGSIVEPDPFLTAQNIWWVQRLNPAYDGPTDYCLQLSDNTNTQDIGFLGAPDDDDGITWLDTFAVFDFIEASLAAGRTPFVNKFYDQVGGVDLTIRSTASNLITLELNSPVGLKPAIKSPGTGTNALAAGAAASLNNLFVGGGGATILSMFYPLGAGGSSQGRIWSKGTGNALRYSSSSSIRHTMDYTTTDLVNGIDLTALGHAGYDSWKNLQLDYEFIQASPMTNGNRPFVQVNDSARVETGATTSPSGSYVEDSSFNFALLNGHTGASHSFNGYMTGTAIWKGRLGVAA